MTPIFTPNPEESFILHFFTERNTRLSFLCFLLPSFLSVKCCQSDLRFTLQRSELFNSQFDLCSRWGSLPRRPAAGPHLPPHSRALGLCCRPAVASGPLVCSARALIFPTSYAVRAQRMLPCLEITLHTVSAKTHSSGVSLSAVFWTSDSQPFSPGTA